MIRIWLKLADGEKELYYNAEKIIEITVDCDKYCLKKITILIKKEDTVSKKCITYDNVIEYSVEEI